MPRKSTLDEVYEIENLKRAWRWLRTNSDARYKGYFRELYSAYAVVDDWFLNDLRTRLKNGIYEPSHACKIYLPKPSGILRPYTLLTVEDQIVYQAMVNVIAEKLSPRIRSRYHIETFGNIYAGKTSVWFYKKWSDSYKKFNDAAREAVGCGLTFNASFDLTACYDSLDHGVLTHFLTEMGCDKEFCEFLKKLLAKWTATENSKRIYLNHGIPQGPLSSGLLSEVVLQYFDLKHRHQKNMRYLRYVDDIHLFASTPSELRKELVRLDLLSKDIGLFPQSGKIKIHEVKDIEEELKSISNPVESSVKQKNVDQKKLIKRLIELSPHFKVKNPTRFKYLLAHAKPSFFISERLWQIYDKDPSLYESMMRYFSRYDILSDTIADRFLKEIKAQHIYPAVLASIIETADGRLPPYKARYFHRAVKALWKPRVLSVEMQSVVGRWVMKYDLLNGVPQKAYALNLRNWYSKINTTRGMDNNTLNLPTQIRLLNSKLNDDSDDVAIMAAFLLIKRNIPLLQNNVGNPAAAAFLKEMGSISQLPAAQCGIEKSMTRMLGRSVTGLNWKKIFTINYSQALQLATYCRALADTNVTAWVNATDSFNDLLLNELYAHDPSIGAYSIGNIGGKLNATSAFAKKYPRIFEMAKEFHDRRLESPLSHAFTRSSGKPTRSIRYSYLHRGKSLIGAAIVELFSKW